MYEGWGYGYGLLIVWNVVQVWSTSSINESTQNLAHSVIVLIFFCTKHESLKQTISTQRCDHITPVLRQLRWLPVRQLAVLVFKALGDLAPQKLADDCQLSGRRHHLQSSDSFK